MPQVQNYQAAFAPIYEAPNNVEMSNEPDCNFTCQNARSEFNDNTICLQSSTPT